ncbi:MAG: NADH-quinone oxidoreductase subunit J [Gammaproteobacteria bacterium]|nr:NADH-quinone oxidoreductase subunit J [Gammaproteobacteria bacterium]
MSLSVFLFYIAAAVAITTAIMAVTRKNASHALIYLVVTLLSIAVIFFLLGAPFAAALEIVIYAGAIVVLFLFVVMMLNLGRSSVARESQWLRPGMWVFPAVLSGILFIVFGYTVLQTENSAMIEGQVVPPKEVGTVLFHEYLLGVELAGVLLLAALVGAFHLGRRYLEERREN